MPRGPKIPPAMPREWLEAYEHGKRIDSIARAAGRTERTIKVHIERARRELEQRKVREGLLLDAYQRHFQDLLAIAGELRDRSQKPDPAGLWSGADRRTTLLRDALKAHTPTSPVWRACREWESLSRRIGSVEEEIEHELAEVLERRFPEADVRPLREGMKSSLLFASREIALRHDLEYRPYEVGQTSEGPSLHWAGRRLSNVLDDSLDAGLLETEHRSLIQELMAWENIPRLADALERWNRQRRKILDDVEEWELRGLLSGQCRLCPI